MDGEGGFGRMTLSVREHVLDSARADILWAAANCFMEQGYNAASIDDVARSLGATKGRIYHYYPSKADLFADVYRTGMDMNYAAVEPYRHLPLGPLEKWKKMAVAHVNQMIATRQFQRAVWEGVEMHLRGATTPHQREVLGALLEYRTDYGRIFRDILAEGREAGVFHFENISIANQIMFMTLNSPIFWYTPRPGETAEDVAAIVRQIVTFTLRGLGAKED